MEENKISIDETDALKKQYERILELMNKTDRIIFRPTDKFGDSLFFNIESKESEFIEDEQFIKQIVANSLNALNESIISQIIFEIKNTLEGIVIVEKTEMAKIVKEIIEKYGQWIFKYFNIFYS